MFPPTPPPTPESESSSDTLQPTFIGYVATTNDALILFEACLTGYLNYLPRRPSARELYQLIRSGCVFIYKKNASGINRWADRLTWCPSRTLENFLVYRELDKPLAHGTKRPTRKKDRRPARPGEPYPPPDSIGEIYSPTTPQLTSFTAAPTPSDAERHLIGSLIDSYDFKLNGLVKKTISVVVKDVTYHLVSYYNVDDVKCNLLELPSQSAALSGIKPRRELSKQKFRVPLEENTDGTRQEHQGMYSSDWQLGPHYFPSYPHAAYLQHIHQDVPATVGPPMDGSFMPQMAPSPIPPHRSYDILHSNLVWSSHLDEYAHRVMS